MTGDVQQAVVPTPTTPAAPPLRLRTPLVLVAAFWVVHYLSLNLEIPTFGRFLTNLAAPALLMLGFLVWWFRQKALSRGERWLGFLVVVAGALAANRWNDPSMAGFSVLMGVVPFVLTLGVLWLLIARRAPAPVRAFGLAVVMLLGYGYQGLLRIDGLRGNLQASVHWRWTPTAEELFLAQKKAQPAAATPNAAPVALSEGDWPGFRGPNRDNVVRGVRIATDWEAAPPKLLWRQRVGPAWSSLCVVGEHLFTQEQRGEQEAVVCYDAATGRERWVHEDTARFWHQVTGAGPLATPTFAAGRVFALGGTGILNALDAATGRKLWSHTVTADAGAPVPTWGFSGSPLVVGDLVIVYAGGTGSKQLLAYRAETGSLAWAAAAGATSYSSPQFVTLAGQPQVLCLSDEGVVSVAPDSGALLWQHVVATPGAPRSVQPQAVGDSQVLIASEADLGTALLDVDASGGQWTVAQRWASRDLKPAFNDSVIHAGHLYGFDGRIFTCVDLQTGKRRWKGGRYGQGQVLLLADQALLLVVTESGEVVLLSATPERLEERARLAALDGKTWNNPVVAHGRLYVRNAEELACYELRPAP